MPDYIGIPLRTSADSNAAADINQLMANIAVVKAMIDGVLPIGTMAPFAGSTIPDGWLLCNGAAVSRDTYSSLFAVIGIIWGAGDGSMTFNLPNTSGVTLKGAGSQTINGREKGAGALGSVLEDQMQGHKHQYGSYVQGASGSVANVNNDLTQTNYPVGSPITDGTNGTPRVGQNTRDSSIAVNYIIKY